MFRAWLLLALSLVAIRPFLLAEPSALKIAPTACPTSRASEITVIYDPAVTGKIKAPSSLTLEVATNVPSLSSKTHSVPFVHTTDGLWTAKLVRDAKEFWFYLIMQVRDDATREIDDNRGAYWDVVFCNPNGMPGSQSVKWQAESYSGVSYENGIERKQDYDKALAILEGFINSNALDRYNALDEYWEYKVLRDGGGDLAWKARTEEIAKFLQEHREDKNALTMAFDFAQSHTDRVPTELVNRLLGNVRSLDPAKANELEQMAAFNRVSHEKNLHRQAAALSDLIHKYPDGTQTLLAVPILFDMLGRFRDVAAAEALFAERVQRTPDWADLYASMAAIYIENHQNLDHALQQLDQAEKLGEAGLRPPPRVAPMFVILSSNWDESKTELGYWRAQAYLQQNKAALALPLLVKAAEQRHISDRVFLLGQCYEAVGNKAKALDAYFEALTFPSTEAHEERARLEHLWLSGRFGTKSALAQKLQQQQEALFQKTNYVPRIVDRPAPAYEFTTLNGEKYRSSELSNKIVVLNFWGVWCAPCLPELPGFQELQQRHPEILVAAIVVDSDADKMQALIQKEKLNTLRIGQNDSLEDAFVTAGVPVTYIIDHGRIRIIHQGSLSNVTAYMEADLAALRKEPATHDMATTGR